MANDNHLAVGFSILDEPHSNQLVAMGRLIKYFHHSSVFDVN